MRKYTGVITVFFFLLVSCATSTGGNGPLPEKTAKPLAEAKAAEPAQDARRFSLAVENPTRFPVYFEGGQRVGKHSRAGVSLYAEDATLSSGFDILYEIPLSDTVALFCKGDHRTLRENQSAFTVAEPRLTENYGTYIKITNNANNAISFYTGGTVNPGWEQKGSPVAGNYITWTDKREFSRGETAVFNISRDSAHDNYFIRDSRANIPLVLPKAEKRNYIYAFEYTAQGLELTDHRPLHRVGEPTWSKTIEGDYPPVFAENRDGSISIAVSTGAGADFLVLDAAGRETLKKPFSGGNPAALRTLTGMHPLPGGHLVTGYEGTGGDFAPVLEKRAPDGVLVWAAPAPQGSDRNYLSLLAAARKDESTWLAAGGASAGGAVDRDRVYLREFHDAGNMYELSWELGPNDIKKDAWEFARASAYNAKTQSYVVAGSGYHEPDALGVQTQSSFVAFVGAAGKLLPNAFSLPGVTLNAVAADGEGAFYLCGQEERGGRVYALVLKHDADGKRAAGWRQARQLKDNAYYQCAVVDEEAGQIVLGGVSQAEDEYGGGGRPFLQGLDLKTGAQLWFEDLGPLSAELNLVTGLQKAADYGFLLGLCGVDGGGYAKPYMLARLNSRGKRIDHIFH